REYKGSHSGEHGDGLVRSEHHEAMFGPGCVRALEQVKDRFDPEGLFNPGKIVRPSKMDDRSLVRFKPDYRQLPLDTVLDWSEWGGFASAAEMCNNNGACRKSDPGVMCPSYRATGDEQHLTRGRANTLRLALSGQLGPEALVSEEMRDTMALGVLGEKMLGFSARRSLPEWSRDYYRGSTDTGPMGGRNIVLLVDTFNRYFEPENAWAAERVLARAGYRVNTPEPAVGRPLCCGRTFVAAGLVYEAKAEARRMLDALAPAIAAGTPIIGLEPACLLT